jgi:hypothetical protein
MYVKIRNHLNHQNGVYSKSGRETVVPTTNRVYETDEVEFTKYSVDSWDEFGEKVKGLGEFSLVTSLPDNKNERFEFLFVTLHLGDTVRFLVAPNATLFVMNKDGKTIDSISCF